MSTNVKALLVGVLWFVVGGGVGAMTSVLLGIGALGGMHSPPAWWWSVVLFGAFVLPLLLAFGWIPTVVQMKREKPALKLAMASLAISALAWLATLVAWEAGRPKV